MLLLLGAAATAWADGAPYAVTQPATQAPATGTTLNGMAVPNGTGTWAWFEWGTNAAYGNQTAPRDLGSGPGMVRVAGTIAGLTTGTTYHFRLIATNSMGLVRGADQVFALGKKVRAWGDNTYGQTNVPVGLGSAVAIAGGFLHSLALKADGTVAVWGDNSVGQTNVPAGLSNVVAIAGGDYHSLVLKADGTVAAWGYNGDGEINVPVGLSNVVAIAAGYHHSLALKVDGTVAAWGYNFWGWGQTNVPVGLSNVVAIAGGSDHSLVLKADGTVTGWGDNSNGQTTVPVGLSNVVAIAAGGLHSLALKADGTVIAWGDNSYGQISVPVGLSNVVAVAAGYLHSLALKTDGTLAAWGYNNYGQTNLPVGLINVVAIAGGGSHSLALGDNTAPVAIAQTVSASANTDLAISLSATDVDGDLLQFRIVALPQAGVLYQYNGLGRGAVISATNTVVTDPGARVIFAPAVDSFGWPDDSFQFVANDGMADSSPAVVTVNVDRSPPKAATQPATLFSGAGARLNGMAVPNYGLAARVWFEWGTNPAYGNQTAPQALGSGPGVVRVTDTIAGLTIGTTYHFRLVATNSMGLAYGADQVFAVGKKVCAWGNNTYGQANVPAGLSNVVAIAGGDYHSLALKVDGTVAAWGYNGYGQTNVPAGLSNVVAIAAGYHHSLALKADGTMAAWGYNGEGEINVPVDLSNVVAIAAGSHSLALGDNTAPVAIAQTVSGSANTDLPISLSATDVNGDLLQLRIISLPQAGVLYQYDGGGRGVVISVTNTVVTDAGGRVIFAPAADSFGWPYDSFQFAANDGMTDSSPAMVTVNIGRLPPRVATQPATLLTGAGARLNGMAVPDNYGLAARAWFEWGTNTAYGNQTAPQDLGSGFSVVWVTDTITGLPMGTTYHFRLVATNSMGLAYGADQVFAVGKKVCAWGNNTYGQANVPIGLSNVVAVAGGNSHSLALKADGTVAAWGSSSYSQTSVPVGMSNVVAIAAGGWHSLALKADGTVAAWGYNGYSQTNVPIGLSNVVAIAGGDYHSLALKADGTVAAWGDNSYGQTNAPAGLSNVVAIAGGDYHSLALKADGTVAVWGDNSYGQTNVPVGLSNVVALAAGYSHSLALKADGTLAVWGDNSYGQTSVPIGLSNVVAIAGGDYHSLAMNADGTVAAWGYNSDGETTVPTGLSNVVAIAGGGYHSLALGDNVPPMAWPQTVSGPVNQDIVILLAGSDVNGDLLQFRVITLPARGTLYQWGGSGGRGAMISSANTVVSDVQGRVIFAPATNDFGFPCGAFQFVANDGLADSTVTTITVNIDGNLRAVTRPATQLVGMGAALNGMALPNGFPASAWFEWGTNAAYGNQTAPLDVGSGGSVVAVTSQLTGLTAGIVYHFRLTATNSFGRVCGADQVFATSMAASKKVRAWGTNSSRQITMPVGIGQAIALAGGASNSLALIVDGTVAAWGSNSLGQTNVPAGLGNVVAIAGGGNHSLALKADGTLAAWGYNYYGQTNVPAGLSNVVGVAAGDSHSLALRADGTVAAWGNNTSGAISIPSGLSNVVAVVAGGFQSLALTSNGTIVAWGYNGQGAVPAGLSNVVAVAAGGSHCLALKNDGTVKAWGNNTYGQTTVPAGLSNVVAIAAGAKHSLALKADGTIRAWGDNTAGQISTPASFSNAVAVAAGGGHSLALGDNEPPSVIAQTIFAPPNIDLLIGLSGTDVNGDSLQFRVTKLPANGALYQCNGSVRGAVFSSTNTPVTDLVGRVIFAPSPEAFGSNYASFQFVANDGMADSIPASVTINVSKPLLPMAVTQPATQVTGASAALNGMAVPNYGLAARAWFEWGTTTAYGNRTAPVDLGQSYSVVRVTAGISGLVGAGLHFRLVTTNSEGMACGADQVLGVRRSVAAWGAGSYNGTPPNYGQSLVPVGNVVAVAGGLYHSVALSTNGTVAAWGYNNYGQTNVPAGLSNVVAIAAGNYYCQALKADGTVVAWGRYSVNGSYYYPMINPAGLSNVVAIAAGGEHTLALKADGTVVAWGAGTNNTGASPAYGQSMVPSGLSNIVAIAAGDYHSLALRADGTLVAWGFNSYGQTNVPAGLSNVVAMAAGGSHCLALLSNSTVIAWGAGTSYTGLSPWFGQARVPAGLSNVVALAAGGYHSLALKSDGTVVAWGAGTNYTGTSPIYGQAIVPAGLTNAVAIDGGGYHSLALGNTAPVATPQTVSGVANSDLVVRLSGTDPEGDPLQWRIVTLPALGALYQWTSGGRAALISATGTVVSDAGGQVIFVPVTNGFGANYANFQFVANDGLADSAPAAVAVNIGESLYAMTQPATQVTISNATLQGMAAASGLTAVAWFDWGTNLAYGNRTVPVPISAGGGVVRLTSGITGLAPGRTYHFRLVATNLAGPFYGADQILGVERKLVAWGNNNAGQINVPAGLGNLVGVAGGYLHSLALKDNGTVAGWGDNTYGQRNVPPGLTNVVAVAGGWYHSLALKADGTVAAWGDNSSGQTNVPASATNLVAIAACGYHSLALRVDGSVCCWGQLSVVPPGLSNVVAVAAGRLHNLALRVDGTVVAWGNNTYGQTNVPAGLSNVVAIAAGGDDGLALKANGTAVAWGYNGNNVPGGLAGVLGIAAGGLHDLALNTNGTLVAWGDNTYGQGVVPTGLSNVVTIASGDAHNLALVVNTPPVATPQLVSGPANTDLPIFLSGTDTNGDLLQFRIVSLPTNGVLYQSANGSRGALISATNTTVSDTTNRVIFVSAPDAFGSNYASFRFVANDGLVDSPPATVTVNIAAPLAPNAVSQPPTSVTDSGATLNGAAVANTGARAAAWFEWGVNTGYGHLTPVAPLAPSSAVVWMTNRVEGLLAGITYHFRLVVTNSLGRVNGADQIMASGKRLRAWGNNSYGQTNVPMGLGNLTAVAAGNDHNLVLRTDGSVAAWGNNTYSQTNVPAGLTQVMAIAAGNYHSLALKSDGSVSAWGYNAYGQTNVPAGLSNVVGITAGYYHSLALRADGSVWVWGSNNYGQTNVPAGLSNVVAVAAGYYHNLALKADGTVAAWGNNSYGQTNVPAGLSNVVAIAAGYYHNLALKTNGTLVAWGYNSNGQTNVPAGLSNVVAIAAGGTNSLASLANGALVVWGANSYGQTNVPPAVHNVVDMAAGNAHCLALGDNNEPPVATPQAVTGLANNDLVIRLSGTDVNGDFLQFRIVNLPAKGTLYQFNGGVRGAVIPVADTWVSDAAGQVVFAPAPNDFGFPDDLFQFVANDGLADSTASTITVNIDGNVRAVTQPATQVMGTGATLNGMALPSGFPASAWFEWGTNRAYGTQTAPQDLGSGPGVVRVTNTIAGLTMGVTYHFRLVATNRLGLVCGADQVFAAGKKVRAWGYNSSGQINVLAGVGSAVALAGGYSHSLALKADGTVAAWGDNSSGQTSVPVGLSNVLTIAGGGYHSLALKADGTVAAWGYNSYGQSSVPVGLSNVVAIAGGGYHSLVLKADGTVAAWGYNSYGQSSVPVGLSNVVAIAAGYYHSLALKADGTVAAWGYNSYGQSSVPVGLSNVVTIAAGYYHSLALGDNSAPVAIAQTVSGFPNTDLAISLSATDVNGDLLQLRIVALPQTGVLYQYNGGGRGAVISVTNTVVTDPGIRVIFAPATDSFGRPDDSFQFVANDGMTDSLPAMVAVNINRSPPTAATQPATLLTGAGARLNGMAVPNYGLAARAWFEWGTNWAYGTQTAPQDLGSGPGVVRVTDTIAGLTIGTTYHFRLVATNSMGWIYGADQVFAVGKKVRAWGDNTYGQTNVPAGLSNAVLVAAGNAHNLALRTDSTVVAWGNNSSCQTNVPVGLSNVVAIAAGYSHSLALNADGTVAAWGNNSSGQTNVPVGLSNVVAIAAGYSHSLALKADGTMAGWGDNSSGQTNVPVGLSNVVAIAGGGFHSLALKVDGTVTAWGDNSYGQTNVPVGLSNVVAIGAGYYHNLALKADGTVVAWGNNSYGQANVPAGLSNVVAIAGGGFHSLALKADGTVAAWGDSSSSHSNVPVGLSNAVAIADGAYHGLALGDNEPPMTWSQTIAGSANQDVVILLTGSDVNGDLLQFRVATLPGRGTLYQCGDSGGRGTMISSSNTVVSDVLGRVIFAPVLNDFGSPYASFQFVANDGMADSTATTITVNIDGNLRAVTQPATQLVGTGATLGGMALPNGFRASTWFEWGTNRAYGNQTAPQDLGSGAGVVRVTDTIAGLTIGTTYHFRLVATNSMGLVYGADQVFGVGKKVLAWGDNSYGQSSVPVGLSNVVAIAAGGWHSLALKADGTVAAWGKDAFGQTDVPVGLSNVLTIAGGGDHSLALKADGTVAAWGFYGQTSVPVGLSNVVAIAGGGDHSLALKADGTVAAWGDNSYGQTNVPVGLSNMVAIAAGGWHSLALKADGTVAAWGYNNYGQTNVPVGLSNVVAIAGGVDHSLALCADGHVQAWGYDNYGQSDVPAGLGNVLAVADSGYYSLALKTDGNVVAWGDNSHGETYVPPGLSGVVEIAGSWDSCVALGNLVTVPQITSCGVGANGGFQLTFQGGTNTSYGVWASTNLVDWQPLGMAVDTGGGLFRFVDTSVTNWPERFYRAASQ